MTSIQEATALHDSLQQHVKWITKHLDEGCAALPLIEAHVVHSGCDDPGSVTMPHLILPLLQERLEAAASGSLVICPSLTLTRACAE